MTRVIYFAEEQAPGGVVTGPPVTARTEFLAALTGAGTEDFESFTDLQTGPFVVSFPGSVGNIQATIAGLTTPADVTVYGSPGAGRFNTTPGGSNLLEATDSFDITFDTPIAAFGFYGTDIGDFLARLEVVLVDTLAAEEVIEIPSSLGAADGSLLFWGFIDDAKQYDRIRFRMNQASQGGDLSSFDIFGFDDMVVGDIGQIAQPPAPEGLRVSRGWGVNRHILTVRIG